MNKNLKKVISSVAAAALAASALPVFAADFTDVAATASYKSAVDELVALNVINGYEDGTFLPENNIKRSEVTKMIVAAMGPAVAKTAANLAGNSSFTDVAADHWASGFITAGVNKGFINGMGDGTFAPEANVTYEQVVKMLVSILGYDADAKAKYDELVAEAATDEAKAAISWSTGYMSIAADLGVLAGVSGISVDTYVTRAQVAQLIDNTINVPTRKTKTSSNLVIGNNTIQSVEYELQDGEDGKPYKTMLTEEHKAYKVKGRVQATSKTDTTLEDDEVKISVEISDNFDGDWETYTKKNAEDNAEADNHHTCFVGTTDAADQLFTYADMLIQKNEDDEFTILTITPYGRNASVDVEASKFEADAYDDTNEKYDVIKARRNATSTSTDSYKLAKGADLIVNGVNIGDMTAELYDAYLNANEYGTVTLIDTPAPGSTTKDGNYDYVVVTYYVSAVVSSVDVRTSKIVVDLADSDDEGQYITDLTVDTDEDNEVSVSVTIDGQEATLEDLAEDDVVSIAFNVNAADTIKDAFAASSFYDITAVRENAVVSGTVTSRKTINKDKENEKLQVVVGGVTYTADSEASLTVGSEYELKVNAFGVIMSIEETASSEKYAILHAAKETTAGTETVTLITADGTATTVNIKSTNDTLFDDAKEIAYRDATSSLTNAETARAADLKAVENRIVTYTLYASGELKTLDLVTDVENVEGYTYNASTQRLTGLNVETGRTNNIKIAEDAAVLDLYSYIEDTYRSTSSVSAVGVNSFVDDESYDVIAVNKKDGLYKLIFVLDGEGDYALETAIALVGTTEHKMFNEDETMYEVTLYVNGEEEKVFFENDPSLSEGDVVIYKTNADGYVEDGDFVSLFSTDAIVDADAELDTDVATSNEAYKKFNADYATGYTPWDGDADFQMVFAPLVTKSNNLLTLANVDDGETLVEQEEGYDGPDEYTYNYTYTDSDFIELELASNVNVLVYDYTAEADYRCSTGTIGSVTAGKHMTNSLYRTEDEGNVFTYSLADMVAAEKEVRMVLCKVVEDEVTDIVLFIPDATIE